MSELPDRSLNIQFRCPTPRNFCECAEAAISKKRRYFVPHEGLNWQIDAPHEGILKGFVLAEIEMKTANQTFNVPRWIGREVTTDPKFRKVNMFAERLVPVV